MGNTNNNLWLKIYNPEITINVDWDYTDDIKEAYNDVEDTIVLELKVSDFNVDTVDLDMLLQQFKLIGSENKFINVRLCAGNRIEIFTDPKSAKILLVKYSCEDELERFYTHFPDLRPKNNEFIN